MSATPGLRFNFASPPGRGLWGWAAIACSLYVGLFVYIIGTATYDLPGAIALGPALVLGGGLLSRRMVRSQSDPVVRSMIAWSPVLKLAAIAGRYFVAFSVYGGSADAAGYHAHGVRIAASLREFRFGDIALGDAVGTEAMLLLTGIVYTVTGPSIYIGFLVFGLLAWFGTYLFLRAFQTARPDGDHRLYADLVLLLPSMLYWPGGIGKESWMVLVLGVASLGAARLLTDAEEGHGALLLILGIGGAVLLRPHMGVLVLVGLVGAVLLARIAGGWPRQALALSVLVLLGVFVASQTQQFFGINELTATSVSEILQETSERTSRGGSEFENVSVSNPLLFPLGFVSVVFRPFPFEAPNLQALLLSFEGVLLAVAFWRRRSQLVRALGNLRNQPYLTYAVAYSVAFIVAFSNFNNLGLLARERVMLYPVLFVLLCAFPRRARAR